MRIAMVTGSSYPPTEGIGVYSLDLARHLVARGHRVTIVTRGSAAMNRASAGGVELLSLPFYPLYPFHVHVHGFFVNRYLNTQRSQFDLFHAHSPLAPVLTDVRPVVTTLHTSLAHHYLKPTDLRSWLTNLQITVSRRLEQRLLLKSQSIAVVNPLLATEVSSRLGSKVSVKTLANGVDTQRFIPDPAARQRDLVVSVGRLRHGKGFEDLLAAWPHVLDRNTNARLKIVGDGPLSGRLRAFAAHLGILDSVQFIGEVSPTESDALLRLYQRASLVVQPSHHEGLSTVVLEAMAVGLPIIATNVGGHETVIDHGVNGVLIRPGDIPALSAAISEVLGLRDASAMGARARLDVVRSYSWARVAKAYEDWYAGILQA